MLPWTDRAGRFSPLKSAALAIALFPAVWMSFRYFSGYYFPKPVEAATHATGDWSLRLLLLTLFVSPLRQVTGWNRLVAVRRTLGVAAFAYLAAHFALYIIDQKYDLARVFSEIALRLYLTIGFLAFLGLAALAATSFDSAIRRLGAARWNRLHGTVYVLMGLSLLHALIQSKLDISEPIVMTGLFAAAMGARALKARGRLGPAWLAALALAAALVTALGEAAWYAGLTGVDARRVLAANWLELQAFAGPDPWGALLSQRPAPLVFALALALPLAALLRPPEPRAAPARRANAGEAARHTA